MVVGEGLKEKGRWHLGVVFRGRRWLELLLLFYLFFNSMANL